MKRMGRSLLLVMALVAALPAAAEKRTVVPPIAVRTSFSVDQAPLTTEQVWALDPGEMNPHERFWVLERRVVLGDVRALQTPDGKWSAVADSISATTVLHLRGDVPADPSSSDVRYHLIQDFPCGKKFGEAHFATTEGARAAGTEAASDWANLLSDMRTRLAITLMKLRARSYREATDEAKIVFREWLKSAHEHWRTHVRLDARAREWRQYENDAKRLGVCNRPGAAKAAPPAFPASGLARTNVPPSPILARAPAKRWSGLFTIRVWVGLGTPKEPIGKMVVGQFLLDSGAQQSLVSPVWLAGQGINADVLKNKHMVEKVFWTGGSGTGEHIEFPHVQISGYDVDFHDFVLQVTDLFTPPEYGSNCCDGVLGADFLRMYAVEFHPGPPPEVILYPRAGFQASPDFLWIETETVAPAGVHSSACVLRSGRETVSGTRWDTANEPAIELHEPWAALAKPERKWDLACDGTIVAGSTEASAPDPNERELNAADRMREPGLTAGMNLLERSDWIMDSAHGKIWLKKEGFAKPVLVNTSGLELDYRTNKDGDRELHVVKIRPGSPADPLRKLGLKPGTYVTKIGDESTDDMDLGDVERKLSGADGPEVTLEWETSSGMKLAPLKLKTGQ